MHDSAHDTGHEQDQGNGQPGPSGVVAPGDSNTNSRANQNAVVTLDSSSEQGLRKIKLSKILRFITVICLMKAR